MHTRSPDVFVGRQPILDREHHVVAYELLFRAAATATEARIADDGLATARLITRAFCDLGIRTVVGKAQAFVNLDAESLMSAAIETLPREQVVLELLETVEADDRILRRCRALQAKGYRFALDDFYRYSKACDPLLEIADIVKIDVLMLDPQSLSELVRCLKPWRSILLAEKVESRQCARQCLALGFQFFQGFFFARPAVVAA